MHRKNDASQTFPGMMDIGVKWASMAVVCIRVRNMLDILAAVGLLLIGCLPVLIYLLDRIGFFAASKSNP